MRRAEAQEILAECGFQDYRFEVVEVNDCLFLRAVYYEADTVTGKRERQQTRHWVIETTMSRSELVATAFKCALTSMEHRTREWFRYRGKAIYMPHYDVDQLVALHDHR